MCVALAALDATVHLQGAGRARTLPLTDLHRLPGEHPERETALEPGELITAVELPALPIAARSTYRKVRDRASYAFALVSVAAALEVEGGTVKDVRLALGGVAHKPWRACKAEDALRGGPATERRSAPRPRPNSRTPRRSGTTASRSNSRSAPSPPSSATWLEQAHEHRRKRQAAAQGAHRPS